MWIRIHYKTEFKVKQTKMFKELFWKKFTQASKPKKAGSAQLHCLSTLPFMPAMGWRILQVRYDKYNKTMTIIHSPDPQISVEKVQNMTSNPEVEKHYFELLKADPAFGHAPLFYDYMNVHPKDRLAVQDKRSLEEGYIIHNPLDKSLAFAFGQTPLGRPQKIAVMERGKYKLTEESALKLARFIVHKESRVRTESLQDEFQSAAKRARIAVPQSLPAKIAVPPKKIRVATTAEVLKIGQKQGIEEIMRGIRDQIRSIGIPI